MSRLFHGLRKENGKIGDFLTNRSAKLQKALRGIFGKFNIVATLFAACDLNRYLLRHASFGSGPDSQIRQRSDALSVVFTLRTAWLCRASGLGRNRPVRSVSASVGNARSGDAQYSPWDWQDLGRFCLRAARASLSSSKRSTGWRW